MVVGFNWPAFHDASSCAIVDGGLVFASDEERYTKNKHAVREPPLNSLVSVFNFLETEFGAKPSDIDAFAIPFSPDLFLLEEKRAILRLIKTQFGAYSLNDFSALNSILGDDFNSGTGKLVDFKNTAKLFLRYAFHRYGDTHASSPKIIAVPHHLAHVSSAHYFSGFDSSAVLCLDGQGETAATSVWKAKRGEFESIGEVDVLDGSLGYIYEYVSTKLGFGNLDGPGKVMGLAPYGRYNKKIYSRFIGLLGKGGSNRAPYRLRKRIGKSKSIQEAYAGIADTLSEDANLKDWNPKSRHLVKGAADLAFNLQKFTDEMVVSIAEWARDKGIGDKIALSGGVALNAKSNMELYKARLFKEMFVFPAANDSGAPIGAASYVYEHVLGGHMKNENLRSLSLGPIYSDSRVKEAVRNSRFKAEFVGSEMDSISRQVAKGAVIAFYNGRSELGPRALGSRSIVADPRRRENLERINCIKAREWWRPLAPSLLSSSKGRYLLRPSEHKFMVLMFEATDHAHKNVPAVVHVDGTTRPQTVESKDNQRWHALIKSFGEESGEELIMNTSFNIKGFPIVETPEDAIRDFAVGGFDALYLDGWLLRK